MQPPAEPAGPPLVYLPWQDTTALALIAFGLAIVGCATAHHRPQLQRLAHRVHAAAARRYPWLRFTAAVPASDVAPVTIHAALPGIVSPLGPDQAIPLQGCIGSADPRPLLASSAACERPSHAARAPPRLSRQLDN